MKKETDKSRIGWGLMLFFGAVACASMRNNPQWGMSPLAIGLIEGLVFVCILLAVRYSCQYTGILIGVLVPIYWWLLSFQDGFMVPVEMLTNLMLVFGMNWVLPKKWNSWLKVLLVTGAAFAVTILGSTAAIWIVKKESVVRSLIEAWNTDFYVGLSLLGAAAVCTPHKKSM